VEIVDDDNRAVAPGQEGRVLVTSMHSHAMPIIRYDIGDRAIAGARCDCGISLPVITQILGRQRSLIELPDGTSRLARLTGEHWRAIAPVHADLNVTVTQVEQIDWESRWKRIDVARVDRLRSDAA
jgi:phenylacetate-CoA ligase